MESCSGVRRDESPHWPTDWDFEVKRQASSVLAGLVSLGKLLWVSYLPGGDNNLKSYFTALTTKSMEEITTETRILHLKILLKQIINLELRPLKIHS